MKTTQGPMGKDSIAWLKRSALYENTIPVDVESLKPMMISKIPKLINSFDMGEFNGIISFS